LAKADIQGRSQPVPKLKVKVDREKCQGHARCAALAPELFALDELGNAHEIGDGSVPEALVDKAYLAKANCPELAIEVIEENA
jgi:ferredoxin